MKRVIRGSVTSSNNPDLSGFDKVYGKCVSEANHDINTMRRMYANNDGAPSTILLNLGYTADDGGETFTKSMNTAGHTYETVFDFAKYDWEDGPVLMYVLRDGEVPKGWTVTKFDLYDEDGNVISSATGPYSEEDDPVDNVKSLRKIHASWNYYPYALYSYTPGDSETGIEGDKFDIIDVVKSADEDEAKRYFKNKRMWYPNSYVDRISDEDYNAFLKEQEELDRYESAVTSYNGFADEENEYDIYGSDELGSDFNQYEDDIQEISQEFTSENTSINSTKLPAIFKMVSFEPGTTNIDYGGGRFDNVADYLTQYDVINLVYDPYNRTPEHNKEVIKTLRRAGGADTATCSNVLNVIKEPEVRKNVLENISKIVKPGGKVYITVYEGSGKGDEGPTKAGYQLNRKTADYLDEIREVFPDATRKGKLIVATNSRTVNSSTDIKASSTEGYVYTYCDECGKKNRVKVVFNNFNEPFNDTEYKCKYCGAYNLLTDPHSYDENGNVAEASQSYLDRIEELMNQGLDEETASREAYAEFYPDEYDADDYDEIYSANYGGAYDVDPEQYFTREDLVEFAEDVVDRLNAISYSKFDYTEVYFGPGNDLELTVAWSDYEDTIKEHIDMRKIRKPSDLCKVYAPLFVNRAREVFSEYGADFGPHYGDYEIYSSKQPNSKLNQIRDKITKVVKNVMMFEAGFSEDEVEEYSVVEVDPSGKVEVRAEVDYDGLMSLCDALNPIVQRYDKDSYFEPVQPGIIQAWVKNKNDVVESSKSPNSVANKYPEYMKVSRGGQDFSVHYNLIDNSPSADAHKMWLEFQASVSAIKPYDDAEYAWAQIENGHINVIKGGKVIQQYYYFDADDMDVENSEWCDSIIEQAIDYISEINDKVEPRMVHNSTDTSDNSITGAVYGPDSPDDDDEGNELDPQTVNIQMHLDADIQLTEDGWDYVDTTYPWAASSDEVRKGVWYTTIEDTEVYLGDRVDMVQYTDELLATLLPDVPGIYHIAGDVDLTFIISGLVEFNNEYDDSTYIETDWADVEFDIGNSSISNFKIDKK